MGSGNRIQLKLTLEPSLGPRLEQYKHGTELWTKVCTNVLEEMSPVYDGLIIDKMKQKQRIMFYRYINIYTRLGRPWVASMETLSVQKLTFYALHFDH